MLPLCLSLAHSLPRTRDYEGDRDNALNYTLPQLSEMNCIKDLNQSATCPDLTSSYFNERLNKIKIHKYINN